MIWWLNKPDLPSWYYCDPSNRIKSQQVSFLINNKKSINDAITWIIKMIPGNDINLSPWKKTHSLNYSTQRQEHPQKCYLRDEWTWSNIQLPEMCEVLMIWVFPKIGVITPKWIVDNGKPYQNGWFGGTTIFGNIYIFPSHSPKVSVRFPDPSRSCGIDGLDSRSHAQKIGL